MRVRPATPDDAPACAAILQRWLDATPWMPDLHVLPDTEAFVRDRLLRRGMIVAEDGGGPSGFLARGEDEAEVAALYVDEGRRRAGVGAALLDAAKAEADRLWLWCFQANEGARRFYRRHGFREGRRTAGENEEGLPDVRLDWERPA